MNDLAIGTDHEVVFGKYLKDGQESGMIDVDKIDFSVQVQYVLLQTLCVIELMYIVVDAVKMAVTTAAFIGVPYTRGGQVVVYLCH